MSSTTSTANPTTYSRPEIKNVIDVSDPEGDAYYEEQEVVPVSWLVVIMVCVAVALTFIVFYAIIKFDQWRKKQKLLEQQQKLTLQGGAFQSSSDPTFSSGKLICSTLLVRIFSFAYLRCFLKWFFRALRNENELQLTCALLLA